MNNECEEKIVKTFFQKRVQHRILFELSSTKRREEALSRLCHTYENVLIGKYMIEISTPNSNFEQIAKLIKSLGAGNSCYSISFCKEIDGKHLPLLLALKHAVGEGFPSIVSCIPGELAYFEAEQVIGPPPTASGFRKTDYCCKERNAHPSMEKRYAIFSLCVRFSV